jgi:hypothetical protein
LSQKVDLTGTAQAPIGPGSTFSTVGQRIAAGLGLLFGLASLVRDAILLKAFGFYPSPDTLGYLDGDPLRTRPYPIMSWLTDAAVHPLNLVWLQLALGAVAVALLVYVVARRSPLLAVLIGLLFTFDMVWSDENRAMLTEGPFMSFSVIALAVLINQYEHRGRLSAPYLIAAGGLFAWTCTIRPSNVYLLPVIALAYLLFMRSVRKVAWLAGGMALLLLATSGLTLYQTGRFRLNGGTGYYLAFPLFSYQLFDAANGPQSRRIDTVLRACDPSVDYAKVTVRTSNQYLWGDFFGCLYRSGWGVDQIDAALTGAYLEGIRARPGAALYSWLGWTSIELGYPPPYSESGSPCNAAAFRFCDQQQALVRNAPPALQSSAASWEQAWFTRTATARQIYLLPVNVTHPKELIDPYGTMNGHTLSLRYVVLIWLLCLGALALIYFRTRGSLRLLGLASAVLVGYVCLTSVVGAVFLIRYTSVLTPMFAVLSATLIAIVLRLGAHFVAGLEGHRVAITTAVTAALATVLLVALRFEAKLVAWLAPRRIVTMAAAAAALAVVLYLLVPPPALELVDLGASRQLVLSGPFVHEIGNAYEAALPDLAPYSDGPALPNQSSLRLYEDGQLLGPAHSVHQDIRVLGAGRFSHWGGVVIFSASDNSDPNTNGHGYTATYLMPWSSITRYLIYGLGGLVIVVLAAVAIRLRGRPLRAPRWKWRSNLDEAGV